VSPARPSRESITLSSMWAQKGHFTLGYLLSDRSGRKIDFLTSKVSKVTFLLIVTGLIPMRSFQRDGHFFFFFGGHSF
jgi:hypothetical protein